MTTLALDPTALLRAVGDVGRAVDLLDRERRRVDRRVTALLDGGWCSPAADAYAAAWAQWVGGALDVTRALATTGELLELARREQLLADAGAAGRAGRLAERVAARLDGGAA